jgi:hypothetical protein
MGDRTLNTNLHFYSQVADGVNAKKIQVAQSIIVKVALIGSIPILTTRFG